MEENYKILVADDDPATLELIEAALFPRGYEITCASSGKGALEAFSQKGAHLALLDLVMPGPGGLECLKEIKRTKPETEVIIITAYGDEESAIEALRLGAFDYIVKPFHLEHLRNSVERALERYRHFSDKKRFIERLEEEVSRRTMELEETKQRLQATFDAITDGIVILDRDFRIVAANFGTASLFAKSTEDLLNKQCYNEFFKWDGPCEECPVRRTFETGRPKSAVITLTRDDGSRFYFEISSFPISSPKGDVDHVVEYIKDTTEQRRQQQFLHNSAKMAAVGQLAAGVAHELGNALGIIGGSVQFLLKSKSKNRNQALQESLEVIDRNVASADRIIRGLLSFAKPRDPSFSLLDITSVLEKACFLLKGEFAKNNINVLKRYCPDVPWVLADAEQMEQVFINILLNSIQAMEEGGLITLETTFDQQRRVVKIEFSDTGKGIPQDYINRIFDPFFTTKEGGTGLGLSVSYRLIQAHGGYISVMSQEAKGTKVSISLPVPQ